jgi:hypothetical protein
MTARTIKLVDTYCTAANWQGCIDSNKDNPFYQTNEEAKTEIATWAAKRDLAIAKVRLLMLALTEHEKRWLSRYDHGNIAARLRALGIEPTWESQS